MRRRLGLDSRALSLILIRRGMELARRIVPCVLQYECVARRYLSERNVAKLNELLKTVYDNLRAAEDEPDEQELCPRGTAQCPARPCRTQEGVKVLA